MLSVYHTFFLFNPTSHTSGDSNYEDVYARTSFAKFLTAHTPTLRSLELDYLLIWKRRDGNGYGVVRFRGMVAFTGAYMVDNLVSVGAW